MTDTTYAITVAFVGVLFLASLAMCVQAIRDDRRIRAMTRYRDRPTPGRFSLRGILGAARSRDRSGGDYDRAARHVARAAELGLCEFRRLELPGALLRRAHRLGIDLDAAAVRGLVATVKERERGGSYDDLDRALEREGTETRRRIEAQDPHRR